MFNTVKSDDQPINVNNLGNLNLDIWSYTVPVLANVVLRYEKESKFVPYIGGGAGGAFTKLDGVGRGDVNGFSSDNSDVVFAYQFKTGVAYNISEKASIDLGYKLFGTGEQTYGSTKVKDVMCHFIGLGFTWKL
jgi:opacity protein-like surface antigen